MNDFYFIQILETIHFTYLSVKTAVLTQKHLNIYWKHLITVFSRPVYIACVLFTFIPQYKDHFRACTASMGSTNDSEWCKMYADPLNNVHSDSPQT